MGHVAQFWIIRYKQKLSEECFAQFFFPHQERRKVWFVLLLFSLLTSTQSQIYTVTLNDQFITDQIADLKEEMADAMDDIRDSDLDSKEDILAAYEQSLEFSLLLLENTSSYTITYTIDQDGYLTETKIEHHYQTDDQDTYLIHTTSLTDYPLDKPESLIPQIEG